MLSVCWGWGDERGGALIRRQFCQIAVNARYICYGLRAGQIRVLHKDTAMRALLRGHTQQIADMRFAPSDKDDIIASFGVDGQLFVKRVVASEDAIDEQLLMQLTVVSCHMLVSHSTISISSQLHTHRPGWFAG